MRQLATGWDGVALKIADRSLFEDDAYVLDALDVPKVTEDETWMARLRRAAWERALARWDAYYDASLSAGNPMHAPPADVVDLMAGRFIAKRPLEWKTYP